MFVSNLKCHVIAFQFFNFYFLPTRYRVAFDNVVSLGFDTYTSHVKHRATAKEELLFGSEFPD